MSNTFAVYGFKYLFIAFAAIILLFNGLYFFVVLPKLTENRVEVGGDAFVTFRQQRYVDAYLALLSEAERRLWYNVAIRHSFSLTLVVFVLGVGFLIVSRW